MLTRGQILELIGVLAVFAVTLVSAELEGLPDDISEPLYCSGCKATVAELDKLIKGDSSKNLERKLHRALKDVCKPDHFKKYEYSTPKMVRACKYMIENHEEMMTTIMTRHYSPDHEVAQPRTFLEKNLCRIITKACLEIEDNEATEMKKKAYENLQQEEIELDGKITKIPKNAKYARPVKGSAYQTTESLTQPEVGVRSDEVGEDEWSVNAPSSDHPAHTEL